MSPAAFPIPTPLPPPVKVELNDQLVEGISMIRCCRVLGDMDSDADLDALTTADDARKLLVAHLFDTRVFVVEGEVYKFQVGEEEAEEEYDPAWDPASPDPVVADSEQDKDDKDHGAALKKRKMEKGGGLASLLGRTISPRVRNFLFVLAL
jgi:hypothetical protein